MSVMLRVQNLKKGTYLSLMECHYDRKTKNSKQKLFRRIGYVEELKKDYVDPIAYFKEEAKELSKESSRKYKEKYEERIPRKQMIKNLGYFLVKAIYEKFKFESVCNFLQSTTKEKYDLEKVLRFLVFSQIINPRSKQKEYADKDIFFEDFDFSEDQLYRGIKTIGENYEYILEFAERKLQDFYKVLTDPVYYDGTNVYFEIDKETEMLKRGPEKNNRHNPIIGFGLMLDKNAIPLSFSLYPGNQGEHPEMHKNGQFIKEKLGIDGKIIFVGDKAFCSGDNMYQAIKNGDGYVFSKKIRGAGKEVLDFVFKHPEEYRNIYNEDGTLKYKIKSEIGEYSVQITSKLNGQKANITLRQKRVAFYSQNYAEKSKFERDKLIAKAQNIIANPSQYNRKSIKDAESYIKNIAYTKDGEIATNRLLLLNEEQIEEDAKYDGYYMLVTSELNLGDEEIIKTYRGLWEIEESFSIMKGVLRVRPIFSKTQEGINAQMVVCFIALTILRLLQKRYLKEYVTPEQIQAVIEANKKKRIHKIRLEKINEIPITQITDFIRNYQYYNLGDDYFAIRYHDLIPTIAKLTGLTLDKKIMNEKDINKILNVELQHMRKFRL